MISEIIALSLCMLSVLKIKALLCDVVRRMTSSLPNRMLLTLICAIVIGVGCFGIYTCTRYALTCLRLFLRVDM